MNEPEPLRSDAIEPEGATSESGPLRGTEIREILLVEDHPEAARGLTLVARSAFPGARIHWASSLSAAREVIERWGGLELALIDLGLPDGSGIDLLRHLREQRPEMPCIVTTIYDDDAHLFPALSAGAAGYLLKEQGPEALAVHLRALGQGMPALSPRVARRMLAYFRVQGAAGETPQSRGGGRGEDNAATPAARTGASAATGAGGLGDLTPAERGAAPRSALTRRETEVLSLIARGLQRGEVAGVLGVSENTIAKFIKDIYRKLNISSRAEAALEASRRGLL